MKKFLLLTLLFIGCKETHKSDYIVVGKDTIVAKVDSFTKGVQLYIGNSGLIFTFPEQSPPFVTIRDTIVKHDTVYLPSKRGYIYDTLQYIDVQAPPINREDWYLEHPKVIPSFPDLEEPTIEPDLEEAMQLLQQQLQHDTSYHFIPIDGEALSRAIDSLYRRKDSIKLMKKYQNYN